MTHVKGSTPSTHTPAPVVSSGDAAKNAQAAADATARQFIDSNSLSPAERQDLADQLRRDAAAVQALTVHPEHDWTTHQAYRAFGDS